ncbi:hypothetical protein [Labrys neptuniae]
MSVGTALTIATMAVLAKGVAVRLVAPQSFAAAIAMHSLMAQEYGGELPTSANVSMEEKYKTAINQIKNDNRKTIIEKFSQNLHLFIQLCQSFPKKQ